MRTIHGSITSSRLTMLIDLKKAKSQHQTGRWRTTDDDSTAANVGTASAPSQIHQLATVLWNILNKDRESNTAILEKLENPGDDLRTNPVQVFTAADLAHLASHLALTTQVLAQQAQDMEESSEIDD